MVSENETVQNEWKPVDKYPHEVSTEQNMKGIKIFQLSEILLINLQQNKTVTPEPADMRI